MGHAEGHHHNETPPGWGDVVAGAIVFYGVSWFAYYLVKAIKPELFSISALYEMQLAGALFFLVWATLGKMIFEPFVEAAIEREKGTHGAGRRAQELRAQAKEIETRLDGALRQARLEGIRRRDEQVERAKKRAAEMLEEARAESDVVLESARKELGAARAHAEQVLASESAQLSKLVIDRVLKEDGRALH